MSRTDRVFNFWKPDKVGGFLEVEDFLNGLILAGGFGGGCNGGSDELGGAM